MELRLIRHAAAAERGPAFPDDTQRPLVAKGERQASMLAESLGREGVRVDLLASSPWLRAWQTASALAPLLTMGEPLALPELAQGDPERTAAALAAASGGGPTATVSEIVVAVGHEPWLSQLAAHLLGADEVASAIVFRKAAVMTLTGALRGGGMRLEAFVPMRVRRPLHRSR